MMTAPIQAKLKALLASPNQKGMEIFLTELLNLALQQRNRADLAALEASLLKIVAEHQE